MVIQIAADYNAAISAARARLYSPDICQIFTLFDQSRTFSRESKQDKTLKAQIAQARLREGTTWEAVYGEFDIGEGYVVSAYAKECHLSSAINHKIAENFATFLNIPVAPILFIDNLEDSDPVSLSLVQADYRMLDEDQHASWPQVKWKVTETLKKHPKSAARTLAFILFAHHYDGHAGNILVNEKSPADDLKLYDLDETICRGGNIFWERVHSQGMKDALSDNPCLFDFWTTLAQVADPEVFIDCADIISGFSDDALNSIVNNVFPNLIDKEITSQKNQSVELLQASRDTIFHVKKRKDWFANNFPDLAIKIDWSVRRVQNSTQNLGFRHNCFCGVRP